MNISHYGFVCLVNFSNEKYIRVKKFSLKTFFEREKKMSGICELFANTSHLTNIISFPIRKFWNSLTFPIPIRTKVGSVNLFLFLFAGKITMR